MCVGRWKPGGDGGGGMRRLGGMEAESLWEVCGDENGASELWWLWGGHADGGI